LKFENSIGDKPGW